MPKGLIFRRLKNGVGVWDIEYIIDISSQDGTLNKDLIIHICANVNING